MRFVARKLSPFSNSCSSPSIPDIVRSLSIPFKRVRDEGPHVLGMIDEKHEWDFEDGSECS